MSPTIKHREGRTVATIVDAHGALLPHTDVRVEQTHHEFGFGNIGFADAGFDLIALANETESSADDASPGVVDSAAAERGAALAQDWLTLFNTATLPFYWSRVEPVRGHRDTSRLLTAARWFARHEVAVKGHPLLWHTLAPQWLMELSDDEAEAAIRERIGGDVAAFAGVIDLWDVINEPVILPVFAAEPNAVTRLAQSKGPIEVIRMAFELARAANPAARLVINDFDLSTDYEVVISRCLDAGVEIDAIGLQTHMHQGYRGEDAVWEILERFARFGLPLQMTETSLVSGELMPAHIVDLNDFQPEKWPSTTKGEARQADEIVRHYRTLVSHPSVESLTYWGLADDGAWLGAPTGLIRADGTRKPAFDALHVLIKDEWWHSRTRLRTDEAGRVPLEGFAGTYRVSRGGLKAETTVHRGPDRHVRLVLER